MTGSGLAGGPLAWDPELNGLYSLNHASNSFVLYVIAPSTGATTALCDIRAANPGHPAVTSLHNTGDYPDGLDYHPERRSLWVSSESTTNNCVVEIDRS